MRDEIMSESGERLGLDRESDEHVIKGWVSDA